MCMCSDVIVWLLFFGFGECIIIMLLLSMSIIVDVVYVVVESMWIKKKLRKKVVNYMIIL